MQEEATKKLFIGNLPRGVRSHDLEEMFAAYGKVVFAKVVLDKETGRSKGYGFVEYETIDEASKAKQELDGGDISGRQIRVDFAKPREGEMTAAA
ncbi:MAG TPA: hypothetical protein PKC14_01620 [Candidatus Absconditabacterales bacterium]|nr:hypothetical protein [Candidatus Absconditabacterales bacterium]